MPFRDLTDADADAELDQLGTIRIVTGILCLTRLAPPIWASRYYFENGSWGIPAITLDGIGVLALIGAVTAGALTPVSTLALLFVTRWYEGLLGSESLSTEILSLLLSLLVIASAGARRSIDAVWLRQPGWIGAFVRTIYRVSGVPSADGLRTILTCYFFAIALINLGGVVNHWHEEPWRTGRALEIIFSSSYMSRVWQPWRAFETAWPAAAGWTAWTFTMSQLVMQTTMLALIWWRPTARLVVAWGAAFFVASVLALQLHYLGAFELLIWIALFHRPRPATAVSTNGFVRRAWAERSIARASALFLLVFVAHETWAFAGIREYPFPRLRLYLDTIGVHSPRVFNHNDLPLGDVWCVVYRGEREELLPYHGTSGERLAWIQWNDLLLYRSSIRWRNDFNPATFLDPEHDALQRIEQLLVFDHRRRHAQKSTYVIDYFTSPASHVDLPPATRFARNMVGQSRFRCSGEGNMATCTPELEPHP